MLKKKENRKYFIVITDNEMNYRLMDGPFDTKQEAIDGIPYLFFPEANRLLNKSPNEILEYEDKALEEDNTDSNDDENPLYISTDVMQITSDNNQEVFGVDDGVYLSEENAKKLEDQKILNQIAYAFYFMAVKAEMSLSQSDDETSKEERETFNEVLQIFKKNFSKAYERGMK